MAAIGGKTAFVFSGGGSLGAIHAGYTPDIACAKIIVCRASTPLNYSAIVASAPGSNAYSCSTAALLRLARSTRPPLKIIQSVW
jgi:hypothetical protein